MKVNIKNLKMRSKMSETTEEVKLYLGHEAKDLVTGFSGIVDQQAWSIEGAK